MTARATGVRWVRVFSIAIVSLCWLAIYWSTLCAALTPDDDSLYLQSTASALQAPARMQKLEDELIEGLVQLRYSDYLIHRVTLRVDYKSNYGAASYLQYLAGMLYSPDPDSGISAYHQLVAERALVGTALGGLACLAILVAGLCLVRDWRLQLAVALGVTLAAVLSSAPFHPEFQALLPLTPERPADQMSWLGAAGRAMLFFIDPGPEFSVFGVTPRSNFILLALLAAVLRWDGRTALSYLALAAAIMVHASAGLMILSLFLFSHMIFRRSELFAPKVIAAIAACVMLVVQGEKLTGILGLGALAVALAGGAAVLLFGKLVRSSTVWRRRFMAMDRALAGSFSSLVVADIGLFLLLWNGSLALILACLVYLDPIGVAYFWSQIHSRIAAIWQPLIFTGAAFVVLTRLPDERHVRRYLTGLAAIFGFVGVIANTQARDIACDPRPRYVAMLAQLETRRLQDLPYEKIPSVQDENVWYYAMLFALDHGLDRLGILPPDSSDRQR